MANKSNKSTRDTAVTRWLYLVDDARDALLRERGAEGWELVAVVQRPGGWELLRYWKRPDA